METQQHQVQNIQIGAQDQPQQSELQSILKKTKQLQEKQQIQKYILNSKQQEVFSVYQKLHQRKKHLLKLVLQEYNQKIFQVDLGLYQEMQQLRKKIEGQLKTIQKLKNDIAKQGLTGVNNDKELIQLKNKREQMENQILVGRKFASTQYIRDYLQKPQAYRVSYEDVKYQYEIRLRVKQSLESQKFAYQQKKQELDKAIKKEKALQQELEQERDYHIKMMG